MSVTPPINPSVPAYPEPTQADHDAMFASVVWLRTRCDPAVRDQYLGMYVALLGEQIIDADRDETELIRRVEALGDTICQNLVVLQYLPTWEESRIH